MGFYYNTLSAKEKSLYDDIYKGLCSYQQVVETPSRVMANRVAEILNYVIADNPEIAYINTTNLPIVYTLARTKFTFTYLYDINSVYHEHMKFLDECEFIANNLMDVNMGDFDKVLAAYEFISRNVKYGYCDSTNTALFHSQSAWSTLFKKVGVCQGISMLFKCLMDIAGVECIVVKGTSFDNGNSQPHAWNIVKYQGGYTHVDVTMGVREFEQQHSVSFIGVGMTDDERRQQCTWENEKVLPQCNNSMLGYCEMKGCVVGTEDELKAYVSKFAGSKETIIFKVQKGSYLSCISGNEILNKAMNYHAEASRWNASYGFVSYEAISRYIMRCE